MCRLEAALLLNLQPATAPFDIDIMLKPTSTDVQKLFTVTDSVLMPLVPAVFPCTLFVASTGRGTCTEDTRALGTCVIMVSKTASTEGTRALGTCVMMASKTASTEDTRALGTCVMMASKTASFADKLERTKLTAACS